MKILPYKNLFIGITDALENIFFNGKYASHQIEKTLKSNRKWGSKDRSFIAQTVYDTVRWKRMIEASMGKEVQLDNLWEFVGTWFILQGEKLPSWEEFKKLNKKNILRRNQQNTKDNFSVRESIPDWLFELGVEELGAEVWKKEIETMNQSADIVIRTNKLKTDKKSLQKALKEEDIETTTLAHFPDALVLKDKTNVFQTQAFKDGLFEVQDAGSQLIADFLKVTPGMRVVDACAGAGGKTLHISALMENKGQIYAMDIHEWKLTELKKRAKRSGAQNIQTKHINSTKVIKRLENSADRVLLDVPCSGLGVIKRKPDSKWKLTPEFIDQIKKEQMNILKKYSKMVKTGGGLVYSTCSILPSENQKQVKKFIEKHPEFQLIKEKQLLPSESGFDGFYMAYLEKTK